MPTYVLVPENIFKLYFKKYRRNKKDQLIGVINRPQRNSSISKEINSICKQKNKKMKFEKPVIDSSTSESSDSSSTPDSTESSISVSSNESSE